MESTRKAMNNHQSQSKSEAAVDRRITLPSTAEKPNFEWVDESKISRKQLKVIEYDQIECLQH